MGELLYKPDDVRRIKTLYAKHFGLVISDKTALEELDRLTACVNLVFHEISLEDLRRLEDLYGESYEVRTGLQQ